MLNLRRTLFISAVVASLVSTCSSARDVHEVAAETTKGRELDEMKCICFPCGGPCVYPSPPPPESYPPPDSYPPPETYPPPESYPPPELYPPPEQYPPPESYPPPEKYPPPEAYPPPEEPYTPPKPYCPPQPWSPPQPWAPPQPWTPQYYWPSPTGKLYPIDPGYISGARRGFADGWLLLVQVLLAWCLLPSWI